MAETRSGDGIGNWLVLAALVVAGDQLSKFAIASSLEHGERLSLAPGWFDLTLVYNTGAAFSFLAGAGGWQRWLFVGIGLAAVALIVWMLIRHPGQRLFSFALSLIRGGAIGNLIDRLVYGKVLDFLLVYRDPWYWPAFNIADSAISIGAVLLIADELRRARRAR
ncbi:MAG: signal peptidase II [Quisquiliibacterium sp.]